MNHLGGPLTQHLFTCVLFGLVDTFQVLSVNEKTLEGIYRRLFFFFPPAKGFFLALLCASALGLLRAQVFIFIVAIYLSDVCFWTHKPPLFFFLSSSSFIFRD